MEITNIPICMRYPQKYETTIAICKVHSEEKWDVFIKILDPRRGINCKDGIGDLDHVASVAARWPHNTAFILRENMEIYTEKPKDVNK